MKFMIGFPKIMAEPNSVTVRYGETVYFLCKADGQPEPQIVWIHNRLVLIT